MITGAVTTMAADLIAQLAIEKKSVLKDEAELKRNGDTKEPYDVSYHYLRTMEVLTSTKAVRTLRLTFCTLLASVPQSLRTLTA